MKTDIQIPVTVAGITFKNPFYVASGPTTKSVRQLLRIEETGWAAASIKLSIDPAPYINRKPRYSIFKDRNALAFTAEKRLTFDEGLKLIADAKPLLKDLKLMANITYAGDRGVDGWVNMAKRFEEAGADIIELNMCCPNMSYNLEMTSGGSQSAKKQTGASMGQHADVASEIVRAIKANVSIPLFVKLTPEGGKIAHVAKALFEAGADAVGGTGNRLGMPPIDLEDPGKAFYHLQKEISMGCHCGSWLKPLAERDIYEIRKVCGMDVNVTAAGGITNWRDGVEMALCGGTLLGVCAETLISGYDIVRPMIKGMHTYMQEHHYTDYRQMIGVLVPQMRTATDVTLFAGYARIKDPHLAAPCKSACPHHVPVQAYVQKIVQGDYRAAYDLITGSSALQSICSLVCTHPCEDACVRGRFDSPVKIRALKQFVLEYGHAQGWEPAYMPAEENRHKIAIVGAGVAGLACATELRKAGYAVTIFERSDGIGGALRYSAPDFVFYKKTLDEETTLLRKMGIDLLFNQALGETFDLGTLRQQGYERVFVATGLQKKGACSIPGKQFALDAFDLLERVKRGERPALKSPTIVAGEGFAAIDAARTAIRLGVENVLLLCPSNRNTSELLAFAKEEGVTIIEGARICSITENDVSILQAGMEMRLNCGCAILAEKRFMKNDLLPELKDGRTTDGYAYIGGALMGCHNVIESITSGRNVAASIDIELRGTQARLKPIGRVNTVDVESVRKRIGYLKKDAHPLRLNRHPSQRITDFEPISRTMTEEEARAEAERCLKCGCGEGCQLCKTICCDFAPQIIAPDTLHICEADCVACGMCFNRCPNANIEMVDLGVTV